MRPTETASRRLGEKDENGRLRGASLSSCLATITLDGHHLYPE